MVIHRSVFVQLRAVACLGFGSTFSLAASWVHQVHTDALDWGHVQAGSSRAIFSLHVESCCFSAFHLSVLGKKSFSQESSLRGGSCIGFRAPVPNLTWLQSTLLGAQIHHCCLLGPSRLSKEKKPETKLFFSL